MPNICLSPLLWNGRRGIRSQKKEAAVRPLDPQTVYFYFLIATQGSADKRLLVNWSLRSCDFLCEGCVLEIDREQLPRDPTRTFSCPPFKQGNNRNFVCLKKKDEMQIWAALACIQERCRTDRGKCAWGCFYVCDMTSMQKSHFFVVIVHIAGTPHATSTWMEERVNKEG